MSQLFVWLWEDEDCYSWNNTICKKLNIIPETVINTELIDLTYRFYIKQIICVFFENQRHQTYETSSSSTFTCNLRNTVIRYLLFIHFVCSIYMLILLLQLTIQNNCLFGHYAHINFGLPIINILYHRKDSVFTKYFKYNVTVFTLILDRQFDDGERLIHKLSWITSSRASPTECIQSFDFIKNENKMI